MGLADTALILLGVGIVSSRFKAGVGLGELGEGITSLVSSPLRGTGTGLSSLAGGIRDIAETFGDLGRGLGDLFASIPKLPGGNGITIPGLPLPIPIPKLPALPTPPPSFGPGGGWGGGGGARASYPTRPAILLTDSGGSSRTLLSGGGGNVPAEPRIIQPVVLPGDFGTKDIARAPSLPGYTPRPTNGSTRPTTLYQRSRNIVML